MPKSPTPGIGHVALTDHRVRRRPADAPSAGGGLVLNGRDSLVLFHRDLVARDDPGVARDLGIALVTLARARTADPRKQRAALQHFCEAALPILGDALARHPGDIPARDARGNALWLLGRQSEALGELRTTLDLAPRREYTLLAATALADELGLKAEARGYAELAAAIDPTSFEAQWILARARGYEDDWAGAVSAATAALALDPTDVRARSLRIQGYLRTERPDEARADYRLLTRVVPDPKALLRWYSGEGGVP